MGINHLKVYPSGFLGSASVEQTEPVELISAAKQLFNKGLVTKSSPYTASMRVIDIWSTATSGAKEYETFEFKESILKCALEVFGTEKLVDWLEMQWMSPEYTDSHATWVDETIAFVYGDKAREMSHNNWLALLVSGNNTQANKEHSKTVKEYMFNKSALLNRSNVTIKQFILNWVRQSGGINDLMSSLNVLFGKR